MKRTTDIKIKRLKEIAKWEKEKARPKKNMYFVYLVLLISIIYATDEIASQIGELMKSEIADDLFSTPNSLAWQSVIDIVAAPFGAIGLLYRPLADKFGRKVFLVINTFGMSLAMLVIHLSNNVVLYVVGACLVQFFVPHDMHVVYIMESSPSKHRARIYSTIKFFANMSVMLIPLLRDWLMENAGEWRKVYFIPAVVGIVSCLLALMTARETDSFIESRLRYLKMSDSERKKNKKEKKSDNAQGGLINALKFALNHKQLRWLYITTAFVNIGLIASKSSSPIMTEGFTSFFVDNGATGDLTDKVSAMVTDALYMFPVGCAVSQVIMGFVSDSKGRKTAAIITVANCLVSFIGLAVGARMSWNTMLVGFFSGAFVGSFYAINDVLIMMIGESSPTNLRSSTMSSQYIITALGAVVSYAVSWPFTFFMGNSVIGPVSFGLLVPGFVIALIVLFKKTNETKGINMETVTGTEWD